MCGDPTPPTPAARATPRRCGATALTRILLVAITLTASWPANGGDARSVRPQTAAPAKAVAAFDAAQSVALFVGIRSFREDETLQNVPYAVDDAIDLAYAFAVDPRVALVRPDRVALALSDEHPRKDISRRRLAELKRNGATVTSANQSQILKLVGRQSALAGADGIFIVSFATHGYSDDGAQYLLAANSLFREVSTVIPAARILDLVAKSPAARSLILIDTCRERVQRQRSTVPEPRSAAPFLQQMGLTAGQVVLYGAAAGKWAYDDDLRQNGVFTGAILDALQCRAGYEAGGIVTIDALAAAVERSVVRWIRINRDPSIRNATQASVDGAARTMPLALCSRRAPADPPAVTGQPVPPRLAKGAPLRPLLAQCTADGEVLTKLYGSGAPDDFVTAYVRWRDGCVAVLRELDERLPQPTPQPTETVRFLSAANAWCASQCPAGLSAGQCALFRETPRPERCFWDLDNAMRKIHDIVVRNPSALRAGERR